MTNFVMLANSKKFIQNTIFRYQTLLRNYKERKCIDFGLQNLSSNLFLTG